MNSRAAKNIAQSGGKSIGKLVVPMKNGYMKTSGDEMYQAPGTSMMMRERGDFPRKGRGMA